MKCKKTAIAIATFVLVTFHAVCQNPEQLADEAAKAYNSMHFDQAIKLYGKIIDNGYESAALYYNLGNAYFRNDENAQAVLYYEKALKLSPNNSDIRHNIEVVNNRLTDKVETVPELFYKRWWKHIVNMMNVDAYAVTNILILSLALLLIAVYIAIPVLLVKKISFWAGIFIMFLFTIGVVAAAQRNHYMENNHEAIVFEPTVNIKSSPDENSKDIFVLHEGTKVTLLDNVADWQEIRISNGSIGWIKASGLRKI